MLGISPRTKSILHPPRYLYIDVSFSLSVCLCLCLCLSLNLLVRQSIHQRHSSIHPSIQPFIHLYMCILYLWLCFRCRKVSPIAATICFDELKARRCAINVCL